MDDSARTPPPAPDLGWMRAALASTEVFALVDPAMQDRVAVLFERLDYGDGTVLGVQGEVDEHLYVIVRGDLRLEAADPDGAVRVADVLGPGDTVGLAGVFADLPRETTAVVAGHAELAAIDRASLWSALDTTPDLLDYLVLPDGLRKRLRRPSGSVEVSEGEYEVLFVRRHWLVLARGMALPVVLAAVMLGGGLAVSRFASPSPVTILLAAVASIGVPLALAAYVYLDYSGDFIAVTNRRVIHMDQKPWVSASRAEARLTRVQDVRVSIPSVWARLLGYGNVIIQTSGSSGVIQFNFVPRPADIRVVIFQQVEASRQQSHLDKQVEMERAIRKAIGREPVAAQGTPSGDYEADPERSGQAAKGAGSGVGEVIGGWFVRLARYWRPSMRTESNRTITWRKHWWVLTSHCALPFIVWLAVGLALTTGLVSGGAQLVALPGALEILAFIGLIATGWLWWSYENWRNDLYRLTDTHIIDIEALPLGFFAAVRQASLDNIQDVRYNMPNAIAKWLNYGHVTIETAAEMGTFQFKSVYDPARVQAEIVDRIDELRRRNQRMVDERQADEFSRWLAAYHRVAGDG